MNPLLYVWILNFAIAIVIFAILFTTGISKTRKALVTGLIVISSLISYRALNQMYGKPVLIQNDMNDVVVLAFSADRAQGKLYLWIQEYGQEPKNYILPYSGQTHKQLIQKQRRSRGGPFSVNIKVKTNQTNRYDESVEGSEVTDESEVTDGYPVLPPKNKEVPGDE